jgi:hypothetical protein
MKNKIFYFIFYLQMGIKKNEMTKARLIEILKERGVKGYSKLTRPELIKLVGVADEEDIPLEKLRKKNKVMVKPKAPAKPKAPKKTPEEKKQEKIDEEVKEGIEDVKKQIQKSYDTWHSKETKLELSQLQREYDESRNYDTRRKIENRMNHIKFNQDTTAIKLKKGITPQMIELIRSNVIHNMGLKKKK